MKKFKGRWFVLRETSLHYWKTRNSALTNPNQPRRILNLAGCKVDKVENFDELFPSQSKQSQQSFCFSVTSQIPSDTTTGTGTSTGTTSTGTTTTTKKRYFCLQKKEDFLLWFNAVQKASGQVNHNQEINDHCKDNQNNGKINKDNLSFPETALQHLNDPQSPTGGQQSSQGVVSTTATSSSSSSSEEEVKHIMLITSDTSDTTTTSNIQTETTTTTENDPSSIKRSEIASTKRMLEQQRLKEEIQRDVEKVRQRLAAMKSQPQPTPIHRALLSPNSVRRTSQPQRWRWRWRWKWWGLVVIIFVLCYYYLSY